MGNRKANSQYRWFVALTMFVATMATAVALIAPSPVIGEISKELGVSLGEATGATMLPFTLMVAISCIIGGAVIDRIGVPQVYAGSLILIMICEFLTLLIGNNIVALIILRALEGIGTGPIMGAVATIAAQWFPVKERSIVTGIQGMAMGLGIAVGFVVGPAIYQVTSSWQMSMAGVSIFCIISLILTFIVMFGPKPPISDNTCSTFGDVDVNSSDFKLALKQPATWLNILLIFLCSWSMQAFNDLTPAYIAIDSPVGVGLGPLEAGKMMMIYQLAYIIGSVLSGVVAIKIFKGRSKFVIFSGFIFTALFSCSIQFSAVFTNTLLFQGSLILVGLFMSMINPQVLAFVANNYPNHITGKVGGLTQGLGMFGGTPGVIVGALALHTTGQYSVSINIVAAVAIIGVVLSLWLNPPKLFVGK
ncbi:MAG: hypothetical protein H6Q73_2174 [Firmicutes bacterium]|nr:hypothetical protein [Bacillota bacterium]